MLLASSELHTRTRHSEPSFARRHPDTRGLAAGSATANPLLVPPQPLPPRMRLEITAAERTRPWAERGGVLILVEVEAVTDRRVVLPAGGLVLFRLFLIPHPGDRHKIPPPSGLLMLAADTHSRTETPSTVVYWSAYMQESVSVAYLSKGTSMPLHARNRAITHSKQDV